MRVLIACVPGYGHLYPLLPLAAALRAAGHQVAIATGSDVRAHARRFGFETFAVGLTLADAFRRLALRFPEGEYNQLAPCEILGWYLPHLFGEVLAPATLMDLEPLVRDWQPDVIVHDSWEFASPLAAASTGIPNVSHTLGLRFSDALLECAAASVAPLWQDRSLTPDPGAGLYRYLCFDITPPGLQLSPPSDAACIAALRPESPPLLGDEHVPAWLERRDSGRPLVYMTLGTNTNANRAMFCAAIDGLADLPLDLLITLGPGADTDWLGTLPANVHAEAFVAQSRVLPHCTAVICHAGAGTTLASLALGIPLVLLPQGADQYLIAERVARAGAGVVLAPAEVTPSSIQSSLERVMTCESVRQSAVRLRSAIVAMPGPVSAVALLAGLTSAASARFTAAGAAEPFAWRRLPSAGSCGRPVIRMW